jgi:acyl dehydratase
VSAPKEWRGRFDEDVEVGDVFRSRLGRTIGEADNVWFTLPTLNTNQIRFNEPNAARTEFARPLVDSTFTVALVTGFSVADLSENAGRQPRVHADDHAVQARRFGGRSRLPRGRRGVARLVR